MKYSLPFFLTVLSFIFLGFQNNSPTYNKGIKSILEKNCTNSDCHGVGEKRGDYTTYAGLSKVIANGKFEKKVLLNKSMPKDKKLSTQELILLRAWVNAGYPEK